MKHSLRYACVVALLCLGGRASAQLDLGDLLKFSLDVAKQEEDGNSALTFGQIIDYNGGITFPMYKPEIWQVQQEAKGFQTMAYDPDDKPAPHWRPGVYADVQYIGKGAKFNGVTGHANYLELTIFGEIDAAIGDGAAFFRLCPYFGYGIGGKTGSGSQKVATFGGDDGYRRFDAGPAACLGYRFAFGGVAYFSYEYGVVNRAPKLNGGYPSDYTDKNRSFALNIAYPLKKIFSAFGGK